MAEQQQETPFSPCSFDFYPGSPNGIREVKSFRFAGAPDGPLPSIPSGEETESDSEEQQQQLSEEDNVTFRGHRRKIINPPFLKKQPKTWRDFPWLCALACVFCTTSGIVFAVASHKVTDLILLTLQEVMHTSYEFLEAAEIASTAGGCITSALSILILSASCISVYHESSSTTPQLLFVLVLYPLLFVWGLFLAVSIGSTFVSAILDRVCYNKDIEPIWTHWNNNPRVDNTVCETILEGEKCVDCIDLYPYHFVFPPEARKEDMWICGREIYLFCDEDLPKIVNWWIMCLASSFLTFLGLVIHLHDLSAFRTAILEESKLRMQHELRYIRSHVKSALYDRPSSSDVGLMFLNKTR